jgi:hypothetical protein
MGLGFRGGLPRGGIGYLGIPLGIGAIVAAIKAQPPAPITVAILSLPICFWLGLGLRADGDAGEATDQVTWETPRRSWDWFFFDDNWVDEFRISSAVILASLTSLGIALYRLYRPG